MKTWEDINVLAWSADEKLCGKVAGQAIADAWNADVRVAEDLNRRIKIYCNCANENAIKVTSLRKQLRELRNELGEAKALCGAYHMQVTAKIDMIGRLERLIERIARGGKCNS